MDYKATDFTPDLRRNRAMAMTAHVMQTIGKYITNDEDNFQRRASEDLFELFYENGVDIVTDQMRADAGLPPRGPKGWTEVELRIMEDKRTEAMLRPFPPMILMKDEAERLVPGIHPGTR